MADRRRLTMAEIRVANALSLVKEGDRVVVTRGVGSSAHWIGHRGTVVEVDRDEMQPIVRVRFEGGEHYFQPFQLRDLNLIERIGELDDAR